MARESAKKTKSRTKAARKARRAPESARRGITPAPLEREREEQESLPPRGARKGGAHA